MSNNELVQRADSANPRRADRETNISPDGKWKSFPKLPHLLQYVLSGMFFGWVKINGKLVRQKLKTDVFTTAKLRLGDYLKELRIVFGTFSEARAKYERETEVDHKRFLALATILLCFVGVYMPYAAANQIDEVRQEFLSVKAKAEKGDAIAQEDLGFRYYTGQGVEKSQAEAIKWFSKAAKQGRASAQCRLGLMYYEGQGVKKDYAEAMKWYRKAADQGYAEAQGIVGVLYRNGEGAVKDYAESMKWHRKAANQGHAIGQTNVGSMFARGQGVENDNAEAYAWWSIAAKGDSTAAKNLVIIEKKMSPQQIGEAQKRTAELRALIDIKAK